MSIRDLVSKQLMIKEISEDMEESKIRFTVTLSPDVNRRLEYISKLLGSSRTSQANSFIEGALSEAEEVLGLKLIDADGQITEYGKEIYSTKKTEVS
ncbi:TPA: hypothetical protein KK776_001672 [Campylobacter jejuni]|nr:hypothetical protein [Campylobacter jejuni]